MADKFTARLKAVPFVQSVFQQPVKPSPSCGTGFPADDPGFLGMAFCRTLLFKRG
jgi:hypothetical protein